MGEVSARARLFRAGLQAGEFEEEEVRLYAYRGEEAARLALEGHPNLDRWDRVTGFVRKWYEQPFAPEDGATPAEIAACEARLGFELPRVVREWFRLADKRPSGEGNWLGSLDRIEVTGELLQLFWEIQGVCAIGFRLDDSGLEDPPAACDWFDDKGAKRMGFPVSEFLLHFLLWETTAAAAVAESEGYDETIGPLGKLGPWVKGAWVSGRTIRRYPRLPLSKKCDDIHGDADTVLAMDWAMTRTPEARARLIERS